MNLRPAQLRNLTWKEVRVHVSDDMQRVHRAWAEHGPGTTREVADKSGLSLLTLRPRTTDLYQVGMVECVDRRGGQGVYAYRSETEAEAAQAWKQDRSSHKQAGRATPAENPTQFLSQEQQVRWAASILGRYAKQKRRGAQMAPTTQLELIPAA
jgi:hypothetical protein